VAEVAPAGRRRRAEIGLVALAGAVAGCLCWLAYRLPPPSTSDFEPVWTAARALAAGQDPYAVVPATGTRYPLYYPLTAVVVGLPSAVLSFEWARVGWAAVSGAIFTAAALRHGRGLAPALLSACFLNALIQGQWSPLLTAAVVLPGLTWIWAAKPSIGAALFIGFPSRRALIGGLILVALSLAVSPSWPLQWVEALRQSNHVAPVARPGGLLLLLALLRWRDPTGRLLAALACVPQTIGLYEALPLFLIPRSRWEGYLLAALSYVAAFGQAVFAPRSAVSSWEAMNAAQWPFTFSCLYLPALALVLLPAHRPSPQGQGAGAEPGQGT
jgi:hypothetical protein